MRFTKPGREPGKTTRVERPAPVTPIISTLSEQSPFDGIEVASRAAIPFTHKAWLGHGSSAVIELVSKNSTKELYALKTFKRYLGRNFDAFHRGFQNEVCVTQRLSAHKHIVSVCQTYKWGRQLSILLSPAASDGDLGAYIAEIFGTGMLKEQRKVLNRAFGCLASGLAYMHRQKIRHKDIKPQNILIHQGSVLYTDFGISFDADDNDTTTIGIIGAFTRRYCAPEVQDHTRRDRKSDVYSLGCVFVEMLDVLEPQLGLRYMDNLPYFEKLDQVRERLNECEPRKGTKGELLRISHDMLEPDFAKRIDTYSVLSHIADTELSRDGGEVEVFCVDCYAAAAKVMDDGKEDLEEELANLSLKIDGTGAGSENIAVTAGFDTPLLDTETAVERVSVVPSTENAQAPIDFFAAPTRSKRKSTKKRSPSKKLEQQNTKPAKSRSSQVSAISRYYCTACNEHGHTRAKCPNKCWACKKLWHKAADCPNKCWTCDQAGHKAQDCPNECDACDEVGHATEDCPNTCWTCGEFGHFERDCPDECWVCGELGHATVDCRGRCHACGKVGHWRKDCGDACFECELSFLSSSLVKRVCANRIEGGELGHWAAQCPERKTKWRPIFEQELQGPYQIKERRRR